MDTLPVLYALLKSHETVDLLILMLGTNDTKERLGANATCIGLGMERLVRKALSVDCWGDHAPNVLIVSPPPHRPGARRPGHGQGLRREIRSLARNTPQWRSGWAATSWTRRAVNSTGWTSCTSPGGVTPSWRSGWPPWCPG